MPTRITRIGLITITLHIFVLLAACVTIQVEQGEVAEPSVEAQYIQVGQSVQTAATDVPVVAATPTVYVPPGQLYYTNFNEIPVGKTLEKYPGIVLHKPEIGLQVEVSVNKEYLMAAGLTDHPDGNISTFVQSFSDAARTSVIMACRVKSEKDAEGLNSTRSGYMVELRFDGKARLMKRINGQETALVDWQSDITLNQSDAFTHIYLLCDGSRILFMANGETVFDIIDGDLTEGDFALGVRNQQDAFTSAVLFDKYAVFEPWTD